MNRKPEVAVLPVMGQAEQQPVFQRVDAPRVLAIPGSRTSTQIVCIHRIGKWISDDRCKLADIPLEKAIF